MTDQPTAPATPAAPRSAAQIEADLVATRERLAATIDDLHSKVTPENLAKEGLGKVKGIFVKESGGLRIERVAAVAVVVVGAVLLRQGLKSWGRRRELASMPDVVYLPVARSQIAA